MSDFRKTFTRYLEQRIEAGEPNLVLDRVVRMQPVTNVENQPAGRVEKDPHVTTPSSGSSRSDRVENKSTKTTKVSKTTSDKVSDPSMPKWLDGAPAVPGPGIVIPSPETHLFDADPLKEVDLNGLGEVVRGCDRCALCKDRQNAVPGEGPVDAKLMVIGEGPGATEDETGRPFVGRAGQLLTDILAAIDCPRDTVFIGNVVKCRPPNNRDPEPAEIEQCLPYLNRQIELIHPSVILAMGRTAACALLNTRTSLASLRNKVHTYRGIPLIVTYHPAALLRNPHWKKPTWDDVRIARRILSGER